MRRLALAAVLGALALVASSSAHSVRSWYCGPGGAGSVKGRVLEGGKPVKAVKAFTVRASMGGKLYCEKGITSNVGRFHMVLPLGTYKITARKGDGKLCQTQTVTVRRNRVARPVLHC